MESIVDSEDEIEECPNVGRHELVEMVKSVAELKYTTVNAPAKFNRLENNTNLNLPPSNWLMSSSSSCGLHQAVYQTPGFASFRMAHMFPDCVGAVDVVSDAENIKQLLKLPYTNKGVISMVVHKVGNTLLLDEFDIQKYLLLKEGDEWKWLRTFILEQLLSYGEKDNYCLKDKSRQTIKGKNLLSKFLYYSLKQTLGAPFTDPPMKKSTKNQLPAQLPITGPVLPEPKVESNMPDPNTNHVFNRNILWTFEDLRMLIGTDMPIFGGSKRPCISLRLREAGQPINVLTGIDYWLDNLMCNVPEVVMCYHLDGIVQKYEIIKTEDLPYLENSQFSPKVVRNVAQNILAFIKANATKAGHTYWLFKARNDDVVKLYDLTTLCKNKPTPTMNSNEEAQDTPFTVPVGMLLYTVARNMKITEPRMTSKVAGSIKALLENCIKLLSKEKYPQIVTSSHYILSDLLIPAGIDPRSPKFDVSDGDSETQSLYDEDDIWENSSDDEFSASELNREISADSETGDDSIAVQNIGDTLKEFTFEKSSSEQSPPPLIASTGERCRMSLEHISDGISCLKFFKENEEYFVKESEKRAKDDEKQRIIHEEQNPNMAKPFKPIPLPYESLTVKMSKELIPVRLQPEDEEASSKSEKDRIKMAKFKGKKSQETKEPGSPEASANSDISALNAEQKQLQYHLTTVDFNSQLFGSWNVHLKMLLLEKACLTYATLAEQNFAEQKYGCCLRSIYMSFRCQHVVMKYMSTIVSQKSCLLGRAGDCFLEISKNYESVEEYIAQFQEQNDIDTNISEELDKDLEGESFGDFIEPKKNMEHVLIASSKCYENALQYVPSTAGSDARAELMRRLGNIRNELGVKYMLWSQDEYNKSIELHNMKGSTERLDQRNPTPKDPVTIPVEDPLFVKLAKKSYHSLNKAAASFAEVQDNVNLAFVYSNLGRFMRLRAFLNLPTDNLPFVQKQKTFYIEAFDYYEKGLDVLGSRKHQVAMWDLVNWEYSTAMYTLAKQLQDHGVYTNATPELDKDVFDYLQKSLTLCDVDHAGSRQILYTYRSGLVHKRLGTYHYCALRKQVLEAGTGIAKCNLQICRNHYEKAANIMITLKEANDLLLVQLERMSLQEFLIEHSPQTSRKLRNLQQSLEICLGSKTIFTYIARSQMITADTYGNLQFFEGHLQFALKNLVKFSLTSKDPQINVELYKKMYMEFLTARKKRPIDYHPTLEALAQELGVLLDKLIQIQKAK